jgi:hypothetical protein
MSDADNPLVTKAMERIEDLMVEARRLQAFINEADRLDGREPRFPDVSELGGGPIAGNGHRPGVRNTPAKWEPGSLFNKPFSTAVRMILAARHEAAGKPHPASVDEIYEALTQGSFSFDTSGVEAQKNSIRISLGKNSATFARLPNSDLFGLVEWYGIRGRKTGRKQPGAEADTLATSDGSPSAEEEAMSNGGEETENL